MQYQLGRRVKEFSAGQEVEVMLQGTWNRAYVLRVSKFEVKVSLAQTGVQLDVMMTAASAPHYLCFNDIRIPK